MTRSKIPRHHKAQIRKQKRSCSAATPVEKERSLSVLHQTDDQLFMARLSTLQNMQLASGFNLISWKMRRALLVNSKNPASWLFTDCTSASRLPPKAYLRCLPPCKPHATDTPIAPEATRLSPNNPTVVDRKARRRQLNHESTGRFCRYNPKGSVMVCTQGEKKDHTYYYFTTLLYNST